jgi:FkbM family methyltransferase
MENDPNRYRIELTVGCTDCASIPKVENAGTVLTEAGVDYQIMHNGLRVVAGGYHGVWMSEIIERLRGHHEPQEEVIFHELLRHIGPTATMIELGGFWSYYSLWFLHGFDGRRAIVLEPDPAHVAVGQANAALNGKTNIEFVQASVGAASTGPRPFPTETSGILRIPEFSVADILASRHMAGLDILHCDTQGAETAVIASCEALLRSGKIRFGVFSTHAHQISGDPLTHQRCLAMLKDFGGRILAEHDVHESFSGDGLIAAYFGTEPLDWQAPALSFNRYSNGIFRNPIYDLAEEREERKKQELAAAATAPLPVIELEARPVVAALPPPVDRKPASIFARLFSK